MAELTELHPTPNGPTNGGREAARAGLPKLVDQDGPNILILAHRLVQRGDGLWTRRAAAAGIGKVTARQHAVLAAIALKPGACQLDLTAMTGMDRSTLAEVVRRLYLRKLITRRRTRQDARAYAVSLTPEGAGVFKKARKVAEAVQADLLAVFGDDAEAGLRLVRDLAGAA